VASGRLRQGLALLGAGLAAALVAAAVIALAGPRPQPPPEPRALPPPESVQLVSTRLLPLRAYDPQGGPPWALRLLRTARGWRCVQVGRVLDGRFGELGLDGAFGGDDRLHPPPPGQIPEGAAAGVGSVNNECLGPGETFAGEIGALDRSAAFDAGERPVPRSDLRRISFGLLGRHALAIAYHTPHGQRTVRLNSSYGAYLIVQPAASHYATGIGAAPGNDNPTQLQAAGLTGALTAILYSYDGRPCREILDGPSCTASLPPHPNHRRPLALDR
jgi:hypothetical protein